MPSMWEDYALVPRHYHLELELRFRRRKPLSQYVQRRIGTNWRPVAKWTESLCAGIGPFASLAYSTGSSFPPPKTRKFFRPHTHRTEERT
jgi:hypothetical protein